MDPLPRMDIFAPVSSCNRFMEFPRGPSSFPTKLNCNTGGGVGWGWGWGGGKAIRLLNSSSNQFVKKRSSNDESRVTQIKSVYVLDHASVSFDSLFIPWKNKKKVVS